MRWKWLMLLALGLVCLRARSLPATEIRTVQGRSFRLHVPPHPAEHPALVVVLHGGGGNALHMERFSRFSQLADRQGFLVVYPEGIGHGWNDGREPGNGVDDVGFVREVVAQVVKDCDVDPARIYATGISNGGFMSARLAAEAVDLFAAIAPVAGGIPSSWGPALAPSHPVSVLIVQGTKDPLVPYAGGFVKVGRQNRGEMLSTEEAVSSWRRCDDCSSEGVSEELPDKDPHDGCRATRTSYGNGKEGSEVVLVRVDGGGHTWPGSGQYLPKFMVGSVCNDFDATEMIWEFFQRHHR